MESSASPSFGNVWSNPVNGVATPYRMDKEMIVADNLPEDPANSLSAFAHVQTGPQHEVYVCWSDYPLSVPGHPNAYPPDKIGFVSSFDGGLNFSSVNRQI